MVMADTISVSMLCDDHGLEINYQIANDVGDINGAIVVKYPCHIYLPLVMQEVISQGVSVFLAQLFLSKHISSRSLSPFFSDNMESIRELLYAVRMYEENVTCNFSGYSSEEKLDLSPYLFPNKMKLKILNLVGGGKDSLASSILLSDNGYFVVNCHIAGLNTATSTRELDACKNLYDSLQIIHVSGFDELIQRASQRSRCLGSPPRYNFIPRGRDLLSVLFVLPLIEKECASFISLGCERDLWENNIRIGNKVIPTHDSQSELVITHLSKIVENTFSIHLFSPIAGLHEINILLYLLNRHPELAAKMQSCFYDEWCGQCAKCTRYYLIQEMAINKVFSFKCSPLRDDNRYLNQVLQGVPEGFPYRDEMYYLLGKGKGEHLFCTYPNELLPSGFEVNLE